VIGAWTPESCAVGVNDTVVLAFDFFQELRRLAPLKP
jgi:hypothetical protein